MGGVGGWVGGVEKLILKQTSASTGVGVEAWAELGKKRVLDKRKEDERKNEAEEEPKRLRNKKRKQSLKDSRKKQ